MISERRFPIWFRMQIGAIELQKHYTRLRMPERLYRINLDEGMVLNTPGAPDLTQLNDHDLASHLDFFPHDSLWIEDGYQAYWLVQQENGTRDYIRVNRITEGVKPVMRYVAFGERSMKQEIINMSGKHYRMTRIGGKWFAVTAHMDGRVGQLEKSDQMQCLSADIMNIAHFFQHIAYGIEQSSIAVKSPLSPDRPVYAPYRGDVEKVRRHFRGTIEFNTASPERRQEILVRRRDHAVRGHWRKLRNGHRIWIEPHRRGDPALGTVTSHLEIKS